MTYQRNDMGHRRSRTRRESERPARPPSGGLLLPRPVVNAFGLVGAAAFLLVLLVYRGDSAERPSTDEAPFQVTEAAESLMDVRLPMEVNERVERWVRLFLTSRRDEFETFLVREGLYGGMIRQELRNRGMPEELIYLAMIESGFSPTAISHMRATGVWQFMGPTARAYGLTVDAWVDERRDPIRATVAALDYLEELHSRFGSWYLAAAAYNAGPGRVSQALRRHGLSDGGDEAIYWQIIEDLPLETRHYVPKILAATLLAGQADHFGFDVEPSLPYMFDRVMVPGGTPLSRVAESLGESTSLIRQMNPHLIQGVTPPGRPYMVRVPQGESHRVVASLSRRGGSPAN
jgi:membrane-bound lytic murein transglycosylase D